jgi:hypothetical protein
VAVLPVCPQFARPLNDIECARRAVKGCCARAYAFRAKVIMCYHWLRSWAGKGCLSQLNVTVSARSQSLMRYS